MRSFNDDRLPPGVVALLKGHTEAVYATAFSPDGKTVLTGSFDKTLKLWDAATGKELKTLEGHQNLVLCAAFSPDGQTIASGGADNTAKLWTKTSVRNLGHGNLVDALAFNPAGRLLATGSHDGTVRIWDVAKAQQMRQINAHVQPSPQPVYSVTWSPDGKQILSGSYDATMKLWDAASGNMVRLFKAYKAKEFEKGHRDGIFGVAFSPDGKLLASGSTDHSIKLWRSSDAAVIRDFVNPSLKPAPLWPPPSHPGWIYSLHFSQGGTRLVSAGTAPRNQGYLAVWNVADGKLLYGQQLPFGPIYCAAVSPNGKLLALACGPSVPHAPEGHAVLLKMPVS
jgi:WD40 repeat protein